MVSTWKIIPIWLLIGVVSGVVLAILAVGPSGASAILLPLGIILGLILSSVHCLALFVIEKFKNRNRLIPLGLLLAFFTIYFSAIKYNEYSCSISGGDSLVKATEYVNEIGYDMEFLNTTGYKLKGSCEFGFEYKSKETHRLVIVDSDGRARLND